MKNDEYLLMTSLQGRVIEFGPLANDFECYVEAGMRAVVERVEVYNDENDFFKMHVNFEPFEEFNLPLESLSWYGDGKKLVSARELDLYRRRDCLFISFEDLNLRFYILDKDSYEKSKILVEKYAASDKKKSYLTWLESQIILGE